MKVKEDLNEIKKKINDFFSELKNDILVSLEFKRIKLLETLSSNEMQTLYS